jgi:thiol:disulfide interchange protein DsbD
MHHLKLIMPILSLLLLFGAGQLGAEEEFLKPDEAFAISAEAIDHQRIRVQWQIAEGYYLYRDKISFRSDTQGIDSGEPTLPEAKIKQDEFFGEVAIYRGLLNAELQLQRTAGDGDELVLVAKSQGCADSGLCYPPHEQTLRLRLPPAAADSAEIAPPGLASRAAKGSSVQNLFDPIGAGPLGGGDDDILPVEKAFRFNAEVKDGNQVELRWQVAPGTYLYQDQIRVSLGQTAGVSLGDWQLPEAKIKHNAIRPDGSEGDLAVYDQDFAVRIPLVRKDAGATRIGLEVAYQGCAEVGICYPPQRQSLDLQLPGTDTGTAPPAPAPVSSTPTAPPSKDGMRSEQDQITDLLKGGNTGLIVLSFFGIGLLLAFTPCIFPMIPILSGIIAGQGSQITTRKAFMLSLIYVLSMAIAYTVAGVIAGLFGENLQAAFQNPWVLWSFALVFVLLSLSMFGYYDLQLPSGLQTRLSQISNKQQGGTYTGVAIMGLLSALIVGPCVAPPLAGALIYIGQSGDGLLGGLALFAMSMGMGLPLIAIGTGAGKLLPRAGAWMDAVKGVFGVMMLGIAIMLLERVIDPTAAMLLWGLLLICSSIYMGALNPLPADASGLKRLWKGLGVALLIYGGLMLLGVSLNGKDTLQPLRGIAPTGGAAGEQPAHLQFKRIKTLADLETEVQRASSQGKAVMLDFYADWCTYCIQFEKYVFTDAGVKATLNELVLLQADVTANDAQDKQLLGKLGIPAPPAILFWNKQAEELRNYRVMGYMDAQRFNAHVQQALR